MLRKKPLGLTKSDKQTHQAPRKGYIPRNTLEAPTSSYPAIPGYRKPRAHVASELDHTLRARGQDLQARKGEQFTTAKQKHQEANSLDSLDLLGDSSSFLSYQQPATPEVVARSSRPSWFGASTQAQQRSLARSLSIGSSTSKALDEFRKLHYDLSDFIESLSPTMDSAHYVTSSPYTPPKPKQDISQSTNIPAFGKPSAIHSPLVKDKSIFNVPKSHRPRPEHHRAEAKIEPIPQSRDPRSEFAMPQNVMGPKSSFHNPYDADLDVVEIPRPVNAPPPMSYPTAPKMYSSLEGLNGGYTSVNVPKTSISGTVIDIPDDVLLDRKFGAADPFQYIDSEKAHKNIKALLEGAFEDDEDVPRTRRRKKIKEKLEEAEAKLNEAEQKNSKGEEGNKDTLRADEGEEDEEEDDGTIEGLKVKLLPHQIDGVAWMRDREVTLKKRKGALPKGGLLADDVGPATSGRHMPLLTSVDGSRQNDSIHCINIDESSSTSNGYHQKGRAKHLFERRQGYLGCCPPGPDQTMGS